MLSSSKPVQFAVTPCQLDELLSATDDAWAEWSAEGTATDNFLSAVDLDKRAG
jgi:hypothetical protein